MKKSSFILCLLLLGVSKLMSQPVLSVPYSENFDDASIIIPALPQGWIAFDVNNDGSSWKTAKEGNGFADHSARSKPNLLVVSTSNNSIDDWVFTPKIHFEAGLGYKIRFYLKCSSAYGLHQFKLHLSSEQDPAHIQVPPLIEKTFNGSSSSSYQLVILYLSTTIRFNEALPILYISNREQLNVITTTLSSLFQLHKPAIFPTKRICTGRLTTWSMFAMFRKTGAM